MLDGRPFKMAPLLYYVQLTPRDVSACPATFYCNKMYIDLISSEKHRGRNVDIKMVGNCVRRVHHNGMKRCAKSSNPRFNSVVSYGLTRLSEKSEREEESERLKDTSGTGLPSCQKCDIKQD